MIGVFKSGKYLLLQTNRSNFKFFWFKKNKEIPVFWLLNRLEINQFYNHLNTLNCKEKKYYNAKNKAMATVKYIKKTKIK